MASFSKTFDFNFRRDHQKKISWALRLWVGRRKEPILGYISKIYEKENSGSKGLIRSFDSWYDNRSVARTGHWRRTDALIHWMMINESYSMKTMAYMVLMYISTEVNLIKIFTIPCILWRKERTVKGIEKCRKIGNSGTL